MPPMKKLKRGIDYEPKRLPNLHAYFINPLPFGRGIGLQHKSCVGVFMKSKCKHGFDFACLMCGFSEFDGKRVWFDWAWQEQQKRIDELDQRATGLALDQMETAKLNAELQKRIEELESKVTDLSKNLKDRELAVLVRQERIDRAIILLKSLKSENDLWGCDQVDVQIDLLEQALKGDDE